MTGFRSIVETSKIPTDIDKHNNYTGVGEYKIKIIRSVLNSKNLNFKKSLLGQLGLNLGNKVFSGFLYQKS